MLASINPLVERARHRRYWIAASAYVVGSVIGGALSGAVAGGLGEALASVADLDGGRVVWIIAALCAVALACEVGRVPVPSIHRQVDEAWLGEYREWVYGLGFGVQLGLGFATIVTTASVYLIFVIGVLSGSLTTAVLIGITFGLARALPLLTMARVRSPAQLRAHLARFAAAATPARVVTAAAVAGTAVVAVASVAGGGAPWPS
ncbi:MAG: hypothetical protein AMXMBFR46_17250 [Acidimicrobiia bacterium]